MNVDIFYSHVESRIVELPDRGPTFCEKCIVFWWFSNHMGLYMFLAWLPERQPWGTLAICINPKWPQ